MTITEHDDDIEETDEDDLTRGQDDDSELVQKLRRQLKEKSKIARKAGDLEKENRTLKGERTLTEAGLSELTDRQKQTLLREVSEITAESLRDAAVELGWAQPEDDPKEREIAEQKAISADTRGAQPKGSTEITPQMVTQWTADRRRAFRNQHPDAFKALMRGESVSGITF